uniref:LRAT domain-containing protein n=1 Tax=Graphocephala atropunctata TaxID=36148 RepID=A0A1B6LAC8_9HEMI
MVHLTLMSVLLLVLAGSAYSDSLTSMKMEAGDVISCHLNGFLGTLGAKHWMLATDSDTVINAVAVGSKVHSTTAFIRDQHVNDVGGCNKDSCQNWGMDYQGRTRGEVVASAMFYKDQEFYYDISGCNCQHWVNKWTKGAGGYSTSAAWWAMPYCKAY